MFLRDIRTLWLAIDGRSMFKMTGKKEGMAYTTEKFKSCVTSGMAASRASNVTMGTWSHSMHKLCLPLVEVHSQAVFSL